MNEDVKDFSCLYCLVVSIILAHVLLLIWELKWSFTPMLIQNMLTYVMYALFSENLVSVCTFKKFASFLDVINKKLFLKQ